jgi:hypothetical protein
MGLTVRVRPGQWNEPLAGIWVLVSALDDPLLRQDDHRLTVHRDDHGHVWIAVAGNNAGVRVQSTPPDTRDLAELDGGPL